MLLSSPYQFQEADRGTAEMLRNDGVLDEARKSMTEEAEISTIEARIQAGYQENTYLMPTCVHDQ
jgi:hypothetical protein